MLFSRRLGRSACLVPTLSSSESLLACRRFRTALGGIGFLDGSCTSQQVRHFSHHTFLFQKANTSSASTSSQHEQQHSAASAPDLGVSTSKSSDTSATGASTSIRGDNAKKAGGEPDKKESHLIDKGVGTADLNQSGVKGSDGAASSVAAAGHHAHAAHRARAEWRTLVFSSWQRGMFTALGVATGVALLLFFLAAPMKADTVQQTAQIASQALEDERLKETATKLSKEVVEQILTDPRSVVLLADVVQTLLKQDTSKIAVTSFIRDIFEDKYTQEITKKFVLKVVSDPWVMDQLYHILFSLVDDLLKDQDTKDALREVLVTSSIEALKDEDLQAQGGRAVRSIVWQTIWNSKAGQNTAANTSSTGTNTSGNADTVSPSSNASGSSQK